MFHDFFYFSDKSDRPYVNIGNHTVPFNDDVRLIFRTRNPVPVFEPSVYSMVAIIDFNISELTIEFELKQRAFTILNRNSESQYRSLHSELNSKNIERNEKDEILLTTITTMNIDTIDTQLINNIHEAKENLINLDNCSRNIQDNLKVIRSEYNNYKRFAQIASKIIIAITKLLYINPIYQFVLDDFINCFDASIAHIQHEKNDFDKTTDYEIRMEIFSKYFSNLILDYLSHRIYECDRLLVALTIVFCLEQSFDRLNLNEIHFFATMDSNEIPITTKSPVSWLSDQVWNNIIAFQEQIADGKFIVQDIMENELKWRQWFTSNEPENMDLPVKLTDNRTNKFTVN